MELKNSTKEKIIYEQKTVGLLFPYCSPLVSWMYEMKPSNTFVSCLHSSQNRSNMFNHQKEFSTMLATFNVYL